MVTEKRNSASYWIREVADQLAGEGFIAVVPDVLSGAAPNGGDADSFPNAAAIAAAMDRLGSAEIARRVDGSPRLRYRPSGGEPSQHRTRI